MKRVFVGASWIWRPPYTCHGLLFSSLWEMNYFLAWLLEEQLSPDQCCHHNTLHYWSISKGVRAEWMCIIPLGMFPQTQHWRIPWTEVLVVFLHMLCLSLSRSPKFPDCHSHASNKQLIPLQREVALNQTPDIDYPPFWEVDRSVSEHVLRGCSRVYTTSKLPFLSSNNPELWSTRSTG